MGDSGEQPDGEALIRAFHVIELLGELQTPEALRLLEKALEQEDLATYVVETLSRIDALPTVEILQRTAVREGLAAAAEEALTRLVMLSGNPELVEQAKAVLAELTKAEPEMTGLTEAQIENQPMPPPTRRYIPPESRDERAYYSDDKVSSLLPPLALIGRLLDRGSIIPFIGAGAVSVSRNPDQIWHSSSTYLPTPSELARFLAEKTLYPDTDTGDLTKVAQYFMTVAGRDALNERLHEVFNQDYPITQLHDFLATQRAPLLIVTTNYDDTIERAFASHGRPYELVIHTTDPYIGDQVLWKRPGDNEPRLIRPNSLDIDLSSETVIYKIHGAVDRQRERRDQYVITEDDYIDFLTRMAKNTAIPAVLIESFQTRSFLFLGYSLRDWNLRVVLSRIKKELRLNRETPSWAIQSRPTPLEQRIWQEHGVHVYDMPLDDFVRHLVSDRRY